MHPHSRRKRKRRRRPDATARSRTTITSLGDDALTEILVRLPSLASLARAALTCPRWRRLATSRDFLAGFRARHGPLPLLGCFFYAGDGYFEVPVFHRARDLPDGDVAAVVRGGDFLLASFFEDYLWTFKDFCQGLLLFASDDELAVFNPISRRRTRVPLPSASGFGAHDREISVDCLLPACGTADAAFRVVSLERDEQERVRIHEYSSLTGEWRPQPWAPHSIVDWDPSDSLRPMHAAGRIYWKHGGKLLCLETAPSGSVRQTHVALPPVPGLPEAEASYVVGDMEDGACCLVCAAMSPGLRTRTLQVWLRREEEEGGSWELGWETKFLAGLSLCAVNAGVLLVSDCENYRAYRLNEIGELRVGDFPQTEAYFFAGRGLEAYPYVPCSAVLLGRPLPTDD